VFYVRAILRIAIENGANLDIDNGLDVEDGVPSSGGSVWNWTRRRD
jgi:hypothetical protein